MSKRLSFLIVLVALLCVSVSYAQTDNPALVGALDIGLTVPEADATDIDTDTQIVVSFNRPVVPLGSTADMAVLASPLIIEPAVEGTGEWINTSIYAFTPSEPLNGATNYQVTIDSLTALDGASLAAAYSFAFSTVQPRVISATPGRDQVQPLDATITIRFNQPMDRTSTEAAFALTPINGGEAISGSFAWSEDSQSMSFTPSALLTLETTYRYQIGRAAQSRGGGGELVEPHTARFTTVPAPGVLETRPANGTGNIVGNDYEGYRITTNIVFKTAMNEETFRDRITIEPEPENLTFYTYSSSRGTVLQMSFLPRDNTTYAITLQAGSEDVYGNRIAEPYTYRLRTGTPPARIYPVTNGNLMLTGAHREDTRMAMLVTGAASVDYELFSINPFDLRYERLVTGYSTYRNTNQETDDATRPYRQTRDDALRTWTADFDSAGAINAPREVLLASETGGTLDLGLYWVRMESGDLQGYTYRRGVSSFMLAVVTANLTIKRLPDGALVWATDLVTGEPIEGLNVTVYHRGRRLISVPTDADGVAMLDVIVPNDNEFVLIEARADAAYGVWYSGSDAELQTTRGYLYTDRPIYRPGEPVHFRGVLRDQNDVNFTVPNGVEQVHVSVSNYGTVIHEADVSVTRFGTFSETFTIPTNAPLGDYEVSVDWGANAFTRYRCYSYGDSFDEECYSSSYSALTFNVAEFRVPEFRASVTVENSTVMQGDAINFLLNAAYYSGGALSDADVFWYYRGQPASFNYRGEGSYRFNDETVDSNEFNFPPPSENVVIPTDADGNALFTLPELETPLRTPVIVGVEGTISREGGAPITARSSVFVHSSDVYVGVRTATRIVRQGEAAVAEIITVSPESEPVAGRIVNVEAVEVRWERLPIEGRFGRYNWEVREYPVTTGQVGTEADGLAAFTFEPPNAGSFRVRVVTMDDAGRESSATTRFYVPAQQRSGRRVYFGAPSDSVTMIADKDGYRPGETAQILLPNPYEGAVTMLITVERAGVMQYEVIRTTDESLLYPLPITDDHAPAVFFSVVMVKGIDADTPNPIYATGTIRLIVEPVARKLTVEVTPSARTVAPRGELAFDVLVTDANGQPVPDAEVGLALTDQAALSLLPPNSTTLLETFYPNSQRNAVYTTVSLYALLDRLTDGLLPNLDGMGGAQSASAGGLENLDPRDNFVYTPLWAPHIVTDANGRATATVTMPDNLTAWKLDARVVTADTRVGQTTTEVISTLPLIVRPTAPRFFVVGDRVELSAIVQNNTNAEQVVDVGIQADGVTIEGENAQSVTITAGGRARVRWMALVADVTGVDLTFYALGADGFRDAAKPTLRTGADGLIPVYRYAARDTTGTAGMITDVTTLTEGIALPSDVTWVDGALNIQIDPSLAAVATESFRYLRSYPHECIEQTVSRFYPNAVTLRAVRTLGLNDPELEAGLSSGVALSLGKLAVAQNVDGGWGWFPDWESGTYVTAYALLGLMAARDANMRIDETMIRRATEFLRGRLGNVDRMRSTWQYNREAFLLYTLVRAGEEFNVLRFDNLMRYRELMSLAARSYLLMALLERDPENPYVATLTSDLTSSALLSATGAHWEEAETDWWNWGSNTRTTSLVLSALIKRDPTNPLLPNVVRWLMIAREGDHWETTQETVWATIALTDWMVVTGELNGAYDYALSLNSLLLETGTVTPETVRESRELSISVNDLLRDQVNLLAIARGEGTGALYYTAFLDLQLPADQTPAINSGVGVTREYLDADGNPITSIGVGDVVNVRLTVMLPEDVYFFALDDPLPSGLESIDPRLTTSSRFANVPTLRRDDERYFWGWWAFRHTELRDARTSLYSDYLRRGTYVYSYQARAVTPGEFQAMPAQGYAFYMPDVFGRSDGSLFTVTSAE
ncbi:MAG: Ig-like domain-containing protein [Chloroflexota bacterium]|nr:Ig-like domain-containing protein [Chloroflexota bacterium]